MRLYDFEIADLVQLKSGSPRMAVESVTNYPPVWEFGAQTDPGRQVVHVVWMVYGTSEVKRAQFDRRLLVPAT